MQSEQTELAPVSSFGISIKERLLPSILLFFFTPPASVLLFHWFEDRCSLGWAVEGEKGHSFFSLLALTCQACEEEISYAMCYTCRRLFLIAFIVRACRLLPYCRYIIVCNIHCWLYLVVATSLDLAHRPCFTVAATLSHLIIATLISATSLPPSHYLNFAASLSFPRRRSLIPTSSLSLLTSPSSFPTSLSPHYRRTSH